MGGIPIMNGNFIGKFKNLGNTKAKERDNIKEFFIMIRIEEFDIRILLYIDDYEKAFKVYLFKTTSLKDAREIGEALKKYHSADYAELEIIM